MNKGKLSRVKLKALNSDSGMTLIEVLLALIITAFISVVISNVTMGASKTLQVTAEEAINAQQSVVFSQRLKADISNSESLYVYSGNKPTSANTLQLCDGIGSNFSINSEKGRPLFTVNIRTVPTNVDVNTTYSSTLLVQKVEYDLVSQVDNFGNKNTYQITRRVCGSSLPPQTMLNVGDALCKSATNGFLGIARKYDIGKPNCPSIFVNLDDLVSTGQSVDANLTGNTILFCKTDYLSEADGGQGFKSCVDDSDTVTYGSVPAQGAYYFGLPYAGCKVPMAVLTSARLGAQSRCDVNIRYKDSNGVALTSIKPLANLNRRIDN